MMYPTIEPSRTALVDVGGVFARVGVMDRMLEEGIDVDHCYGVSAGAANMMSFIAGQHGRNHKFYTKYAFRKEYASFDSYFKHHNFANLDYIYGTLSNHDGEISVGLCGVRGERDRVHRDRLQCGGRFHQVFRQIRVHYDDFDIMKASSAVPVACEPYVVDGVPYFDGGIVDPVPVQKAIDDGYDRIVLVLTRPKDVLREQKRDIAPARILRRCIRPPLSDC